MFNKTCYIDFASEYCRAKLLRFTAGFVTCRLKYPLFRPPRAFSAIKNNDLNPSKPTCKPTRHLP